MGQKDDPRITLLDTASFAFTPRPEFTALFSQRVNARRYIFDQTASFRIGQLVRDCIDLLVDNIEFARPPYPTTYIEFDARSMWQGWRPEQPIAETSDLKVGYLIHGDSVLVLVTGGDSHQVVSGLSFRINRPQTVPMAKLMNVPEHLADLAKQAYVFGGQRIVNDRRDYRPERFDDKMAVYLPPLPAGWSHAQIAGHFDVRPVYPVTVPQDMVEFCFLGGGDPIILITCLLLLNQPSRFVTFEHHKREQGIYRGKLKSFKEHHVVRVKLDADMHAKRLFQPTDRATPIFHDVEGHWKHYNKSEGCNHHFEDGRQAWEPIGDERTSSGGYKRYWCPLCLQRRTWTDHYFRGDGQRGVATKEYSVSR